MTDEELIEFCKEVRKEIVAWEKEAESLTAKILIMNDRIKDLRQNLVVELGFRTGDFIRPAPPKPTVMTLSI